MLLKAQRAVEFLKLDYSIRNAIRRGPGPLVLVHTMGKVGSVSVYQALKDELDRPVFHTHFLSEWGIRESERFHGERGAPLPYNIRFSRVLRRHLDGVRPTIVTLVRDPIAVQVSAYFQIGDRVYEGLRGTRGSADVDLDAVVSELTEQVATLRSGKEHVNRWFDREVRDVFGIDVFARPFDYERGYITMSNERARLVLLRLEDLDRAFAPALRELFGTDAFSLPRENVTREGSYGEAYRGALERLRLPADVCRDIYETRLGRHFYADMAADLVRNWAA